MLKQKVSDQISVSEIHHFYSPSFDWKSRNNKNFCKLGNQRLYFPIFVVVNVKKESLICVSLRNNRTEEKMYLLPP